MIERTQELIPTAQDEKRKNGLIGEEFSRQREHGLGRLLAEWNSDRTEHSILRALAVLQSGKQCICGQFLLSWPSTMLSSTEKGKEYIDTD